MGEKEEAILEIERLMKELRMLTVGDWSFNDIYTICESIMVTIEEADLF